MMSIEELENALAYAESRAAGFECAINELLDLAGDDYKAGLDDRAAFYRNVARKLGELRPFDRDVRNWRQQLADAELIQAAKEGTA